MAKTGCSEEGRAAEAEWWVVLAAPEEDDRVARKGAARMEAARMAQV